MLHTRTKNNWKRRIKKHINKKQLPTVEILDRADSLKKLEYKEMLYIRKLKPTLNKQVESELFTLIIRNVQLDNSITRDAQKYLNNNKKKQQPKK